MKTARIDLWFSIVFSAVVALTVAWGVALVGMPGTVRLQRFDQRRLEDLQTIYREIQLLCHDPDLPGELKRPLPETLEELTAQARSAKINSTDPKTGQPYAFAVTGDATYRLCATFALERDADDGVFWNHPAGEHCYTIDVLDRPTPVHTNR